MTKLAKLTLGAIASIGFLLFMLFLGTKNLYFEAGNPVLQILAMIIIALVIVGRLFLHKRA